MHIITGLLLSGLFRKRKKSNAFKGFKGIVEIMHIIPGRIRFRIPLLKNNMELCRTLEQQLNQAGSISHIQSNRHTGTLLVIFDRDKIDPATLTGVLVKLTGQEKEVEQMPQSVAGKELSKLIRSLNSSVYTHSDGFFDLNSMISLVFLSLGLWTVIRRPSVLPAGISLVYWAYNNTMRQLPS